jgi:hypothetical protein
MRRALTWALLASVVALAACQTTAEYETQVNQSLDARLSGYHGSSMAEFIARTGLTPVNAYPIAGGRVFVIQGQTYVVPGAYVTRATSCQLLIQTVATGAGGTASDWKIVGTSRSGPLGPCNELPV